jgi:methylmalonyl-CoA mutase C-terminal domain/subunit
VVAAAPLAGRRAVVAKLGMDAHWRGAIVVARGLRDAGAEVIYLGHATPAQLTSAVMDEDPDMVGLSCLSGNHMTAVPECVSALKAAGYDGLIVLGGAIPHNDGVTLKEKGVSAVFPTGSSLSTIIGHLAELFDRDHAGA